jgi:diguanylate cyclase (GGDEF)-like protein
MSCQIERGPLRLEIEEQRPKPAQMLTRRQFLDRLDRELVRAKSGLHARNDVLLVDLDRFRVANASLGRQVCDDLLVEIVDRFAVHLSHRDAIARIGGDEFAILLEESPDAGTASELAERLQVEMIAGFTISENKIYTTASIGIVRIAAAYKRVEEIMRDAEIAMYYAKSRGRARSETFQPVMYWMALDLFELETDLRRAVERGEFELHYQPIVSAATGRVTAFESLLRWRHPERGLQTPADFIDLLKETGLITSVGKWVIQEACLQAKRWQEIAGRPIPVTINLAPQQFTYVRVMDSVTQAIEDTGVDPRALMLEITEETLVEDIESARKKLAPLRERGVRIMIDDFGTGYSSLSYLRHLSIDAIKIDASFIDRIERVAQDRMIVSAVVALAHALELSVIAEGVERKDQLTELMSLECEQVQGFLISKPVDAATATQMVETDWTATLNQPEYELEFAGRVV